jgi:hypothetical protein
MDIEEEDDVADYLGALVNRKDDGAIKLLQISLVPKSSNGV